jgi:hypothetical protein
LLVIGNRVPSEFPIAPTLEQALEVTRIVPLDTEIETWRPRCSPSKKCTRCLRGGAHGPYYRAYVYDPETKRVRQVHVGKEARMRIVRIAHEVVRRALAEAERRCGEPFRELLALERRAYAKPRRTHDDESELVEVPIFDLAAGGEGR